MKNFTQEQKELLRIAMPIMRNWLRQQFKDTDVIPDDIRRVFTYLNQIEANIYQQWHQLCLKEMQREKLNLNVPELYAQISDPKVSVSLALTLSQRYYGRKEHKEKQKHIGKMISLIKKLADREKSFYKKASERLQTEKAKAEILEEIARGLETINRRDSEDLLYTRQSIKHIGVLRKLGFEPSVHEIYQALEPRFANNDDLYQRQIRIVMDTYTPGQDVATEVKDVCFEFIKESISVAGYFHANLIAYIFQNDFISDKAFQLFVDMKKIISDHGMNVLVYTQAKRLSEKLNLADKRVTELTASDMHILKLIDMFRPLPLG